MDNKHNELGRTGEDVAAGFLRRKGHLIIEKNYRFGHKEIDIISLDRDILVFSEIKTRSNFKFGFPEEAVNQSKRSFLKIAAEAYLQLHSEYGKIRFDVISILIRRKKILEITHFEDAFY